MAKQNSVSQQVKKHWTAEELDNTVVAPNVMSPQDEQKVINKIVGARVQILIGYPFMGYLLTHFEFYTDYTCKTAATDGTAFYYNPYYIQALSPGEVGFILVHELAHAFLKHVTRRGTRDPEKWNYACDYCVHSLIMQYLRTCHNSKRRNAIQMPKNCLYSSKYDNMSAEEIYAVLPNNFKKQAMLNDGGKSGMPLGSGKNNNSSSGKNGNSDGNDDGGNSSNNNDDNGNNGDMPNNQTPLDDHSKWYTAAAQKDASRKEREWAARLVAAQISANSKQAGNLPGYLARLIDRIAKPQIAWQQLLQEYLIKDIKDYTFMRPDNRIGDDFGDIKLPGFFEELESARGIIFAVDVSGSMSDEDIRAVYSEIVGASQMMNISGKITFWDCSSSPFIDFEDTPDIINAKNKVQGGGGTDVNVVFENIDKNLSPDDYHVIVICSDMYFSLPEEKVANGKPVIWVIVNNDESITPKWGKIVRIEPHTYK